MNFSVTSESIFFSFATPCRNERRTKLKEWAFYIEHKPIRTAIVSHISITNLFVIPTLK